MRILMYHEITDERPEEMHAVSKAEFSNQMRWLRQSGYHTVQLADWLAQRSGAGPRLDANSVVITFDDGYLDNYTNAWPILAENGLGGAIFLVAGRMGLTSNWRPGAFGQTPLLSWAAAREMALDGISFGSHTLSHADLSTLAPSAAARELHDARQQIEQALGQPVLNLAYPYGRFTPAIKDIVRRAGYRAACSCPTGYVGATNADPYDLRRITVLAGDQLSDFVAKVQGDWRQRLQWYRRVLGVWRRQLAAHGQAN